MATKQLLLTLSVHRKFSVLFYDGSDGSIHQRRPDAGDSKQLQVVVFATNSEALDYFRPWYSPHSLFGPMLPEQVFQQEAQQKQKHETLVKRIQEEHNAVTVGYIRRIVNVQSSSDMPLTIRERYSDTGTRVWFNALVMAKWIDANRDQLSSSSTILEIGAGAGLPGLICASMGLSKHVILADYGGNNALSNDLMQNLLENAELFKIRKQSNAANVSVISLDWANPCVPMEWKLSTEEDDEAVITRLLQEPCSTTSSKVQPCSVQPASLIIGSELIYQKGAATLLLQTISIWLQKQHRGAKFILIQNPKRAGVEELEVEAQRHGFQLEIQNLPQEWITEIDPDNREEGCTWPSAFVFTRIE